MPITVYLDGYKPDPETKRVMGVAFEMTRAALRLVDRDDLAVAIIAKKIIELAKAGERNVEVLCEAALNAPTGAVSAPNRPPLPTSPPGPPGSSF